MSACHRTRPFRGQAAPRDDPRHRGRNGFVGPNTMEALVKKFFDADFSQDRIISG
jgi:hypothetical protein